jgi:Tfp pilus assembly protein PilO
MMTAKNLTPILLILLVVGLWFVYIKPEYDTILALRDKKAVYDTALADSKEIKALRDSLVQQYNAIPQSDLEKLKRVVPEKYDPVKLVADINNIGLQYGFQISKVKINEPLPVPVSDGSATDNSNTPYKIVSISFSTEGQYQNFVNFLQDLEASRQLIDIRRLGIGSVVEKSGVTKLSFDIMVDTYWIQ